MPAAARIQDPTSHGGTLQGSGVASVRIAGQAAAVASDPRVINTCPPSNPPHPSAPILGGSSSVTFGGSPAARVGDKAVCGAAILAGAFAVTIGG
jgi:uncharacterized Zn-binding protein involved in type VI secretion